MSRPGQRLKHFFASILWSGSFRRNLRQRPVFDSSSEGWIISEWRC